MEIELHYLNIIVGTLIPLLVGLLAKARASASLKAWLNASVTGVAAAIMVTINACASDVCTISVGPFVTTFIMTYVPSIASYYGFWKPTGTASLVQSSTREFGISDVPAHSTHPYITEEGGAIDNSTLTTLVLVLAAIALVIYIITSI